MLSFNCDLFAFLKKDNSNSFGLTANEYSKLSYDTIQLLKHEYSIYFNHLNTTNEMDMINQQYNEDKVLSLKRRK